MSGRTDDERARRLAIVKRLERDLSELFAYANGLDAPARAEAREYLRAVFQRAASTPAWGVRGAVPGLAKPAPAPVERPKGPPCRRCNGSGLWKGHSSNTVCFGCNGTRIERPGRAGNGCR